MLRHEEDDDDTARDAISSPMHLGRYIPRPGMFPRVAKLEYHAGVSFPVHPSLCGKMPERGDAGRVRGRDRGIDSRSKTLGKQALRCIRMQYCGYHRRQIPDRWLITTSNREMRIGDIGDRICCEIVFGSVFLLKA